MKINKNRGFLSLYFFTFINLKKDKITILLLFFYCYNNKVMIMEDYAKK